MKIRLKDLQTEVALNFANIDALIGAGEDPTEVRHLDRAIKAAARAFIRNHAQLDRPGIYLFAKTEGQGDAPILIYIGLVSTGRASNQYPSGRTAFDRISDYLTKEITVLDGSLARLAEDAVRTLVMQRIAYIRPSSFPERLLNTYTERHMKSWRMSMADTIFFAPVEIRTTNLEKVETGLIYSALQVSEGMLINKSKTKKLSLRLPSSDVAACLGVIENWEGSGLSTGASSRWRAAIGQIEAI